MTRWTLAAALALSWAAGPAWAKPIVPKGYDGSFPNSYYHVDYRQSPLNALLKEREFPYRVYRSLYDGSFIVVERKADRTVASKAWAGGDPEKGPQLAFGSQRRSGEDRQRLSLVNALWVLELPGEELYTSAFDPYRPVGRRDLRTGRLVFSDINRVADLLSWLGRGRKDASVLLQRVREGLAGALHADGGAFVRLEARATPAGWAFAVRTDKTRADQDPKPFYSD